MEEEEKLQPWKLVLSALMLVVGMVMTRIGVAWFGHPWVMFVWYVVAFLPVGWGVMLEAWEHISEHHDVFTEFTLMSVAAIGAFAIGEYPEAVAVMLLYCIGELLQDKAVDRAKDHIKDLVSYRPDRAMVVTDGVAVAREAAEVAVDSVIEVKPGERVPLDGLLQGGAATFNTAALTGESLPRMIDDGNEVLAGMIVVDSPVRIRTTRMAGDSAISRILSMVQEASERKAPTELFIRRFARVYTPVVVLLAALMVALPWLYGAVSDGFDYDFGTWFHRALVFLVISCPCALVISVPLTYFGGIGAASRRGILFKGGNFLDAIREVDTVVFDKTGTLTTGQFAVTAVEGLTPDMLDTVAAMERSSNHPLAQAICQYHPTEKSLDAKDIPGYGLEAHEGGHTWLVGTLRLLDKAGVGYPSELKGVSETLVVCACNGQYVGCLKLADMSKEDARNVVGRLASQGVKQIEILSGDKQELVERVAADLHIARGYGDLLPQDKVAHIRKLQSEGRRVAFVGDGINDAPVLAMSDVSIAMGAMGTDLAIETADIILQTDQPSKVAEAVEMGRRTYAIARQNIILALGIKALVMLLGVLGMANLWGAVFADTGVALLAVLNATRILIRRRECDRS
uniref:P-type Zn(2+) transporter n=1 Tax=Prevotella sp. GTC17253 TaxID=3236793 RepID=A0AB33IUH7_9BACT